MDLAPVLQVKDEPQDEVKKEPWLPLLGSSLFSNQVKKEPTQAEPAEPQSSDEETPVLERQDIIPTPYYSSSEESTSESSCESSDDLLIIRAKKRRLIRDDDEIAPSGDFRGNGNILCNTNYQSTSVTTTPSKHTDDYNKLKCKVTECPFRTSKPGALKRHELNHGNRKFKKGHHLCQYCSYKCTGFNGYTAHLLLHVNGFNNKKDDVSNESEVYSHENQSQSESDEDDRFEELIFPPDQPFAEYLKYNNNLRRCFYQCSECEFKHFHQGLFSKHLEKHKEEKSLGNFKGTPNEVDNNDSHEFEKLKFKCMVCPFKSEERTEFQEHMRDKHNILLPGVTKPATENSTVIRDVQVTKNPSENNKSEKKDEEKDGIADSDHCSSSEEASCDEGDSRSCDTPNQELNISSNPKVDSSEKPNNTVPSISKNSFVLRDKSVSDPTQQLGNISIRITSNSTSQHNELIKATLMEEIMKSLESRQIRTAADKNDSLLDINVEDNHNVPQQLNEHEVAQNSNKVVQSTSLKIDKQPINSNTKENSISSKHEQELKTELVVIEENTKSNQERIKNNKSNLNEENEDVKEEDEFTKEIQINKRCEENGLQNKDSPIETSKKVTHMNSINPVGSFAATNNEHLNERQNHPSTNVNKTSKENLTSVEEAESATYNNECHDISAAEKDSIELPLNIDKNSVMTKDTTYDQSKKEQNQETVVNSDKNDNYNNVGRNLFVDNQTAKDDISRKRKYSKLDRNKKGTSCNESTTEPSNKKVHVEGLLFNNNTPTDVGEINEHLTKEVNREEDLHLTKIANSDEVPKMEICINKGATANIDNTAHSSQEKDANNIRYAIYTPVIAVSETSNAETSIKNPSNVNNNLVITSDATTNNTEANTESAACIKEAVSHIKNISETSNSEINDSVIIGDVTTNHTEAIEESAACNKYAVSHNINVSDTSNAEINEIATTSVKNDSLINGDVTNKHLFNELNQEININESKQASKYTEAIKESAACIRDAVSRNINAAGPSNGKIKNIEHTCIESSSKVDDDEHVSKEPNQEKVINPDGTCSSTADDGTKELNQIVDSDITGKSAKPAIVNGVPTEQTKHLNQENLDKINKPANIEKNDSKPTSGNVREKTYTRRTRRPAAFIERIKAAPAQASIKGPSNLQVESNLFTTDLINENLYNTFLNGFSDSSFFCNMFDDPSNELEETIPEESKQHTLIETNKETQPEEAVVNIFDELIEECDASCDVPVDANCTNEIIDLTEPTEEDTDIITEIYNAFHLLNKDSVYLSDNWMKNLDVEYYHENHVKDEIIENPDANSYDFQTNMMTNNKNFSHQQETHCDLPNETIVTDQSSNYSATLRDKHLIPKEIIDKTMVPSKEISDKEPGTTNKQIQISDNINIKQIVADQDSSNNDSATVTDKKLLTKEIINATVVPLKETHRTNEQIQISDNNTNIKEIVTDDSILNDSATLRDKEIMSKHMNSEIVPSKEISHQETDTPNKQTVDQDSILNDSATTVRGKNLIPKEMIKFNNKIVSASDSVVAGIRDHINEAIRNCNTFVRVSYSGDAKVVYHKEKGTKNQRITIIHKKHIKKDLASTSPTNMSTDTSSCKNEVDSTSSLTDQHFVETSPTLPQQKKQAYLLPRPPVYTLKDKNGLGESQCSLCPAKIAGDSARLRKHLEDHQPNAKGIKCPCCTFKSGRSGIFNHIFIHADVNGDKWTCPICKVAKRNRAGLNDHVKIEHFSEVCKKHDEVCPVKWYCKGRCRTL